jgi:hypothetical protein
VKKYACSGRLRLIEKTTSRIVCTYQEDALDFNQARLLILPTTYTSMPQFIAIPGENGRVQYLNIGLIRYVQDLPDEDSVRVEFDDQHRLYLDRGKAAELLERLGKL